MSPESDLRHDTNEPPPQDRQIDRRSFVLRMAAVSAAVGVLPNIVHAVPASGAPAKTLPDPAVPGAALRDVTKLSVGQAAKLIRTGKLSSVRLTGAYLDRIGSFDHTYHAFNLVLADAAMRAARRADQHRSTSPLHGIPLAIKDNYFSAGVKTTASSFVFADFVPPFDATALKSLLDAGAIMIGKTQMGPLATTRATTPDGRITTVNAWTPSDPTVDPGGSSTGSACAVAGRLATSSVGTQTGGSIILPSNRQNLTGLKPTHGRVSLYGIIPLTYSRDHPGPLARDAMDAAIMLQAMAGPDPNDPRTLGLPPVPDLIKAATPVRRAGKPAIRWSTTVGVPDDYLSATGEELAARQSFLAALSSIHGVTVKRVAYPDDWSVLAGTSFNNVRLPERSEPFLPVLRDDLTLFGVSVVTWLQGALLGGNEFIIGQRGKALLLQRLMDDLFTECDVVLQTSPNPFDAHGLPEIGLPIGFTSKGVPIGTIVGGQPFAEDRLLALGAAYQQVTDWHTRFPADPAGSKPAAVGSGLAPARPSLARATGTTGAAKVATGARRISAVEAAASSQ